MKNLAYILSERETANRAKGGKEHYNYYIGQLIQGLSNNVLLNSKKKFFQTASVST